jgi:hypothetical protein
MVAGVAEEAAAGEQAEEALRQQELEAEAGDQPAAAFVVYL